MADDKEQHRPREEVEARAESAPEALEVLPRGNMLSEADDSKPGTMPSPLPN